MFSIAARVLALLPALSLAFGLGSVHATDVSLADRSVSGNPTIVPRLGGAAVETEKKQDIFDEIWALPTIYKNENSAFLNEFRFVGRVHLDQYSIDSDLGYDQDWIVRRLRFGGKAEFFQRRLTLHVEVDVAAQGEDTGYRGLTDAYLSWKFSDAARFGIGKQSVKFTLDGSISSNELLTTERSNIANNFWFPQEYMPGVNLSGKVGDWIYNTGFYSGGTGSLEFGNFDAGNFFLVSAGYDFAKKLGVKRALLRGDYVYNQRNEESTFTRSLENVGAAVFILECAHWGLNAEVDRATGYAGQGDLFGCSLLPWYSLTDRLQVVARYTYIGADEANSIRFARPESYLIGGRGDEYNELYAGVNYYLHGHKLKLQTGYTYATMHDRAADGGKYAGWSVTTALRVSW